MGSVQGQEQEAEVAINSLPELIGVARALLGPRAALSTAESGLVSDHRPSAKLASVVKGLVLAGDDPLGDALCRLRSGIERRELGAVYTPQAIVQSMVAWAAAQGTPTRIVDPGCGSGRYILAAAHRYPTAELVAVDLDPLAVLLLRANATILGLSQRLTLHCSDYRDLVLPDINGRTLYIGNPPYLRHHGIDDKGKAWFAATAKRLGFKASNLAGLHIHFFLKTRDLAKPGDFGAFITSAEWLDVNYGSLLRELLADGLGGSNLHVFAAKSLPFAAAVTGAITCFKVGAQPQSLLVQEVETLEQLGELQAGKRVDWSAIASISRWSVLIRGGHKPEPGHIELGELFRVHRGQVTGANAIWTAGNFRGPLPQRYLMPTVTSAEELFSAGMCLVSSNHLRRVIDLPVDLALLDSDERAQVEEFLKWARLQGADRSYVAQHRAAWWSVRLRAPAPILCTYMARRSPAFVSNAAYARHINIAHGLYPREEMSEITIKNLVSYLRINVHIRSGRTYAGGLTKFEPKEIERLTVPHPDEIHGAA
jgi:SAM-dependent methyltransferase